MKLLIVEDDTIQSNGLKHIIEDRYPDADIITASSYDEAVSFIDDNTFDLFMLDINLGGGKTGLDVCSYIRSIPDHENTPVIFITDIITPNLDVINRYHCKYYFSKPYSSDDVITALRNVISAESDTASRLQLKDIQGILFHITTDEFICVCASGHHKHLFTTNGDFIVTSPTFQTISENYELPLVRCHKSYYFNPAFIHSYDRSNSFIQLKGIQDTIPVGRKYKSLVETYMENR